MYWKRSHAEIINGDRPGGDGILASANERANEFAISELREIPRLAYLDKITSIRSGRARK